MGNDDYSPTKRMTGGTIPALIWHNIMTYAHQNVELRPLPGLPPTPQHAPPPVADAASQGAPAPHQILLTRKGTEALVRVERLLDDASRAMPAQGVAAGTLGALGGEGRANTQTAASEQPSAAIPRGD
jgi:penicillin-binding protein 1A